MYAMKLFALMINNTRQPHSFPQSGISLSILNLGTPFLLIPPIYLNSLVVYISASDYCVT